jgi:hypothetical protein
MRASSLCGNSVVKKQSNFEEYHLPVQGLGLGLGLCQDPVLFEFPSNIFIELINNSDVRKRAHTDFHVSKAIVLGELAQATPLKSASNVPAIKKE